MDPAGEYTGGVILALDCATRTGVAWGEPGSVPVLETVNFGKPLPDLPRAPAGQDSSEIFGRALVWINQILAPHTAMSLSPGLVVIEGLVPQYDKTLQCGLWAIMTGVAAVKGIPIVIAPIQTWRAFVLGQGNLKKDLAKTRAVQTVTQLGWQADSHDAAEAGCIWLWACGQVCPGKMPKIPMFMRVESAGKARSAGRAA